MDFARRSRVVAWLLGGLNFQIEHHLFPRICHVNYPAILWAGLASHFCWLRRLGMPSTAG